jgi:type IV pilus assembly protein PilW
MKTFVKKLKCQVGLTLVELMVAMVISLVLLGGIYRIFVGSTTTYAVTDQLSRTQENGRFAMHVLRNDLLGAGFQGCLQDVSAYTNVLNNSSYFNFNFGQAIYGLEATGANTWADDSGVAVNPTSTGAGDMGLVDPVSGSDILVIRGVDANTTIEVTRKMEDDAAAVQISAGLASLIKPGGGDILLITDCEGATVFQTTGYSDANGNMVHNSGVGTPGNFDHKLGHAYARGSHIFFPQTRTYYIRNNTAGEPALYEKIGSADAEELIEGIESMQIRYGEDTDADRTADVYRTATTVADWGAVVSVRVGLLVRSPQTIAKAPLDTNQYDVDGDGVNDFDPTDDRRLRLVMISTVGIRNRLR